MLKQNYSRQLMRMKKCNFQERQLEYRCEAVDASLRLVLSMLDSQMQDKNASKNKQNSHWSDH